MFENTRYVVLIVLALPAVAAALVAALGPSRRPAVRWVALAAVLVHLAFTSVLTFRTCDVLRSQSSEVPAILHGEAPVGFEPQFVPGDSQSTGQTTWNLFELPVANSGGKPAAVQLYLGMDGLNVWLILLTSFLMVPSVLVSWNSISDRANEFFAWLLVLESAMIGVFMAFDVVLFYVFFELTLVPLFFLIGIWGGPSRREAARKFFLYTLAGSMITLLGMIGLVLACQQKTKALTLSIPRLTATMQRQLAIQDKLTGDLEKELEKADGAITPRAQELASQLESQGSYWRGVQWAVFLALAVGFAVKVPLFPVHTWLPLAHVEAPTAGSVLLAGVLLKLGTYGFLRLCLPLVPDACLSIGMPLIGTLAAVGIVYGAFCAFAQNDIKRLVAYSSVSHLGFCMLGLFSLNTTGITGSIMQMINHGLSTGGLFLLVGMIYERYHTRMKSDYGGMAARLKLLSLAMVLICLSSVGMPFLNGFVGEMMVLAGVTDLKNCPTGSVLFGVVGAAGIVLGAWYLFTMLQQVFFGPLKEPHHDPNHGPVTDLTAREWLILTPILGACLAIGIYPQPLLNAMKRDVAVVSRISYDAQARADKAKRLAPDITRLLTGP